MRHVDIYNFWWDNNCINIKQGPYGSTGRIRWHVSTSYQKLILTHQVIGSHISLIRLAFHHKKNHRGLPLTTKIGWHSLITYKCRRTVVWVRFWQRERSSREEDRNWHWRKWENCRRKCCRWWKGVERRRKGSWLAGRPVLSRRLRGCRVRLIT